MANVEQFGDLTEGVLNTSINNSVTTIILNTGAILPSDGPFDIEIDPSGTRELVTVPEGGISGSGPYTFTGCTRGAGTPATTAASHTSGVVVKVVWTYRAVLAMRGEQNRVGLYANLPDPVLANKKSRKGDVYRCTDSPYTFVNTGGQWQAFYKGNAVTVPPSTGWSWDNQSSSSVSFASGMMDFHFNTGVGTNHMYYRTAPGAAPYTLKVQFEFAGYDTDVTNLGLGLGIVVMDPLSSGNPAKFIGWNADLNNSQLGMSLTKWNNNGSINGGYKSNQDSSTVASLASLLLRGKHCMVFSDDGTNFTWSWSYNDGYRVITFDQHTRGDFLTAPASFLGIGCYAPTGSRGAVMSVFDWTIS